MTPGGARATVRKWNRIARRGPGTCVGYGRILVEEALPSPGVSVQVPPGLSAHALSLRAAACAVFIFGWTQGPLFENGRSSEDQIADAQFCRAELRSCLSGARPMLCRNGLRSVVAADKSQDPVAELTRHDDTGSGVFAEECL